MSECDCCGYTGTDLPKYRKLLQQAYSDARDGHITELESEARGMQRTIAELRKMRGGRIKELEAEQQELVYDCRDHRIAKEKALAQLAELREAAQAVQSERNHRNAVLRQEEMGTNWIILAALLQGEGNE